MEIRRIVAGLAPGKLSDQAIARAIGLAREFGARLDVVHGAGVRGAHFGAARRAFFAAHGPAAWERARDMARRKLELLVADPVYARQPVDDYLHVSEEPGTQAVLRFARENDADLIVLGAHRHTRPFDLGGTSRAVLAKSGCPVWVEPAEPATIERVLAPIDLSTSTEVVLGIARDVGQRLSLPVRVLHVFVPPEFAYDPVSETGPAPTYFVDDLREAEREATRERVGAFEWGECPVEVEFADGEPADEIARHAGPADLVVMGTHGHSGLARALLGSVAYRFLARARGPFLVVPLREAESAAPA
jgi:nucleotide-binding universal stress UspA family protein